MDQAKAVFRNELTACLALTAPAGMTEENRRDWLSVAWLTLKDIPPDLLAWGATKARMVCDHPSKIVPTIIAETAERMCWRRDLQSNAPRLTGPMPKRDLMDRRGEPMSDDETDELNRILEWSGANARYRADGTRYFLDKPQ